MSITYDVYPKVLRALELLSQGRSRTHACDEAGISIPTFEDYCKEDIQLQRLLIDAERRGYDAMADALLTINQNDPKNPYAETNPQMAKVVSDNIKWVLDKRDRKRFGQHVEIKHEITADQAIINALDAAKRRKQSGQVVDLEPEDYAEVPPAPALLGHAVAVSLSDGLSEDEAIMRELLS